MTRINPCCHITAFIPFLPVAGEQEPAAVCAWSSTKIEICLVFISQSSRHLSSPPLSPSSTLFFSFFKWRTVMVCIEVVWEAGNEGGGGEKVIGCTIASHTAFKCFSPTVSRVLDNMSLCMSCSTHCGKLDCDADSTLQRYLSVTHFSLKKHHKENTSSETSSVFPGQEAGFLSL